MPPVEKKETTPQFWSTLKPKAGVEELEIGNPKPSFWEG